MIGLRTLLAAAIVGASFAAIAPAKAEGICGYWAFAGAHKSRREAAQNAIAYGGDTYNIDNTNSPNAGKGLYLVAKGPYRSKRRARKAARKYRRRGIRDAYAKYLCYYGG